MFCGECGTQNPDTNQFCKNCGRPLKRQQQAVPAAQAAPAALPLQAAVPVPAPQGSAAASQAPVQKTRSWPGIFSVIISLIAWIAYPIILGVFAVLAGIAGIYAARKAGAKIPVSAVIGIILGLLAIVLNFFWLDIFPPPQSLPPIQ